MKRKDSSEYRPLSMKKAALFFRQVSAGLSAGVSIISVTSMFSSRTSDAGISRLAAAISRSVETGGTVSEVMERWRHCLPSMIPAIIRMGESTGNLDGAFGDAADILEFHIAVRRKILRSLAYPGFLLLFSFLVIPLPRLFLSGPPAYLRAIAPPILTLFALIAGSWLVMGSRKWKSALRYPVHRFLLKVPVLKNVLKKLALSRFAYLLSTCVRSGISVFDAVRAAADGCGNEFIKRKIYAIIPNLMSGSSLARELEGTAMFPPLFLTMLDTGERSGTLDEMLARASRLLEDEAFVSLEISLKLLGHFVLIAVAVYIGYVIIDFWRGYWNEIDSFNRMAR